MPTEEGGLLRRWLNLCPISDRFVFLFGDSEGGLCGDHVHWKLLGLLDPWPAAVRPRQVLWVPCLLFPGFQVGPSKAVSFRHSFGKSLSGVHCSSLRRRKAEWTVSTQTQPAAHKSDLVDWRARCISTF